MSKYLWKTGVLTLTVCACLNVTARTENPTIPTSEKSVATKSPQETTHLNHYKKMTDLTPSNPEVKAFIDEMVKAHHLDQNELNQIFKQVTYQPKIIRLIEKPAEKRLTWGQYRAIFMKPYTIKLGVEFWQQNHAALSKAQKEYGVSPAVIVGILGVETRFGRITGGYKAIEALATLSFAYPPREKFFRKELEKFLVLSHKEKMDPLSLTGSYAGALGMSQFMPSSYLAYAVDFTKSGQADIWNTPADAIGSIANYLQKHGWKRGQKVAVPAIPEVESNYESILSTSPEANIPLKKANDEGLKNTRWLPSSTLVRGLKLDGAHGDEYWLTTQNFYAITRYNRSDLYAMAVFQLGNAIERSYHKTVLVNQNNQDNASPTAPIKKTAKEKSKDV